MRLNSFRKIPTLILTSLALILFGATIGIAAPGDLDPTFGNGGIVITTVDPLPPNTLGSVDVAYGTAIQPDGKIVVVGSSYSYSSGQDSFAVVRYQPNGSLDTSFNGTGIVITPVNTLSGAISVALQADGKIVVAGSSLNSVGDFSFAVVRYQPNGLLDTSFNGTGIVITPFGNAFPYYKVSAGLAIQGDGKIVVVASNGDDSIIVRYSATGSLDTSFNGTGRIIAPFSAVSSVAIQTDGKIVVVGSSLNSASLNKFTISRYTADGSPDTSFGGTGKVVIPGESPSQGWASSVAIQPDGKIVAAGSTTLGLGDSAIVRCNPDGSLDTTFGGTGIVNLSGGVGGRSLAIQPGGKIVAAGNIDGFFPFLFAVVRLNPNGSPDSTFGNGTGRVITSISGYESSASSVAIQADGKIVVAGSASDQFDFIYFAVVRYQGDAPSSSCSSPNPIDCADFFVRQQYLDFLGREPDPPGLAGWLNILNNCGVTVAQPCDRIEVSSAFFRSPEFQGRGYFIYRFYPTIAKVPIYSDWVPDFAKVSGFLTDAQLEAAKAAFVTDFMNRPEFQSRYASTFGSPSAYVDALLQTVGLPNHPSRQTWIDSLSGNNSPATRAQVLRSLVESNELYQKYYNEAFVVMQYFGYLRRTADAHYLDWIQTMNQNNGDYRLMINGFINSAEYRQRFGQ